MYVCMYVCICIYLSIYLSIYLPLSIYTYIYIYVYVYLYIYIYITHIAGFAETTNPHTNYKDKTHHPDYSEICLSGLSQNDNFQEHSGRKQH